MAVPVRIDPAGLDRLFGALGPLAADLLRRGRNVEAEAKRLCPVDEGRLRSSITTLLASEGGLPAVYVGTNVSYALFVHEGTRPHFPPVAPIAAWASRVGLGAGAGFPVARAISRRGTPARPFLRDALPAARR
jgi:hypothetical protein